MDNTSLELPGPAAEHPVRPSLQSIIRAAANVSEDVLEGDVNRNWNRLNNTGLIRRISEHSDSAVHAFSRDDLVDHLKDQMATLEDDMKDVHTPAEFREACLQYIDSELVRLFFCTNNPQFAIMGKAYFDHFLMGVVDAAQEEGVFTQEEAEEGRKLLDYYETGMEAFKNLCDEVAQYTGDETRSLVTLALSSVPENEIAKARALLKDGDFFNDDDKLQYVMGHSIETFRNLLMRSYAYPEGSDALHPMEIWICHQSLKVAAAEESYKAVLPQSRSEHSKFGNRVIRRCIEIRGEIEAYCREHGMVDGIIHANMRFPEMVRAATGTPHNFTEMLAEALDAGEVAANEALPLIKAQEKLFLKDKDVPVSRSTVGVHLWPSAEQSLMEKPFYIEHTAENIQRMLEHSHSLRELAERADVLADKMAEGIFFSMEAPESIVYTQHFLEGMRRDLGEYYLDAGNFDMAAFSKLKRVEEKCAHYYRSHHVAREWLMEDSQMGYDRYFLRASILYTARTGIPFVQQGDVRETEIEPMAQKEFENVLRSMRVLRKKACHPAVPEIYQQCLRIAEAEIDNSEKDLGAEFSGNSHDAMATFFQLLHGRAAELFDEALGSLPTHDKYTGRSLAQQPFEAEDLMRLMERLRQLERLASVSRSSGSMGLH